MSDLAVNLYTVSAGCLLLLAPMPGWIVTEHRRATRRRAAR